MRISLIEDITGISDKGIQVSFEDDDTTKKNVEVVEMPARMPVVFDNSHG